MLLLLIQEQFEVVDKTEQGTAGFGVDVAIGPLDHFGARHVRHVGHQGAEVRFW